MARLSDRYGRRPIFISGVVGSAVMIFIYFSVISTENVPLIFLTSTLITAGTYAMSNAIYPLLLRRTVQRPGAVLGHGHRTPDRHPVRRLHAADRHRLDERRQGQLAAPALLVAGSSVLAAIGAIWARETYQTPLEKLGNPVHHRGADADREELSVG